MEKQKYPHPEQHAAMVSEASPAYAMANKEYVETDYPYGHSFQEVVANLYDAKAHINDSTYWTSAEDFENHLLEKYPWLR